MTHRRHSFLFFWIAVWIIIVLIARKVFDILKDVWPLILFLLLFVWFCWVAGARAQSDIRPQVLLIYDHKEVTDEYIVQVKAIPVLSLRYVSTYDKPDLAPVEYKTLMLCRPYYEDKHLMFRCGQDRFVMDAINFQPEK